MPEVASRPRTGFATLDQGEARRTPMTLAGVTVLPDPTGGPMINRWNLMDSERSPAHLFRQIDQAYVTDSYAHQGVDKYVELTFIRGYRLDCQTDEPVQYLRRRFQLMGIMTRKPWKVLIADVLNDAVKYHNVYLIARRGRLRIPIPGVPETGALGQTNPILGYYRADPSRMWPDYSPDGKRLVGYRYRQPSGGETYFKAENVLHFALNVQAGHTLGSPHLGPVLDDIREYRRCEEYVIRLLYKHLNPLLHHKVTEKTAGFGASQGDVNAAAAAHAFIAPDGMIVTPPNHEIVMIGAESRALRGEGYLALLKQRVFTGLGVSQVAMGEGAGHTAGSADAQTAAMHNKAHFIQEILAELLTEFVLYELLMEGGYDPLDPQDEVHWVWNDFEIETRIKIENNAVQLFTNDGITRTEMREMIGKRPMTEEQAADTHAQLVTIQVAEAEAKAAAQYAPPPAAAGGSKPSGAAKQAASKARPSNQHGTRSAPKVRPK